MLDEIIKVAEKLAPETISLFETAKTENQFLKAIESVEDALPRSLFIDGQHNPLKFLHAALSKGLHAKTDDTAIADRAERSRRGSLAPGFGVDRSRDRPLR